ncbi:outer membrane protein OmpA-like peptidoglycan-associated protein [Haloactinospora alba]|uniref:Outer membrane protein OmpA-like peptidoglycan-associated protein n=1 Tax=Haloactinospora alba TaxID=405555 RepID=A0A543NK97_9ACTN|nr:OmpA family protein [Haloactinospora alba]TQN32248.1 outer membrane protein OmpA-like peptidoglycan-associated protein [Haloactinospora alba]
MIRRTPLALVSLLATGGLLLGGCGLVNDADKGGKDGDGKGEEGKGGGPDGFVQEGYVGRFDHYLNARVEVAEVARLDDRTRTTVHLTSLEEEPVDMSSSVFAISGVLDQNINGFRLLDPVNQRDYGVYSDIGTELPVGQQWQPGVTYEIVVFSPPLQDGVDRVTVHAPGGIGEFAGVPVTEGEPRTYPTEDPEESPSSGDEVTFPVDTGDPEPLESDYAELRGVVHNVVQGRDTSEDEETVSLRADVLFEFDESALTDNAESVLEDVIEDTRERADPDNPPITIAGHTDGVGGDDYNQELSEERAESVKQVLAEELGDGYEYETEGHGSSDPVETEGGDDDAWARAQNRRVEVSYAYKDEVVEETEEKEVEEEVVEVDPAEAGEPADFRSHADAEPVATGELSRDRWQDRTWTMRVYPFYRDGAYLVARFDLTFEGGDIAPSYNPFGSTFGKFDFSVVDPKTGKIYQEVVLGDPADATYRVASLSWPSAKQAGETAYAYMYVPAPPESVESVTFNGADFGRFTDVPIVE